MAVIAVPNDRLSTIVGYAIEKGVFGDTTPNLPQRIAILGEANLANQSTLDTTPKEIITAQEAGEAYGFGSPIHAIARILKPVNSSGVGGIPVIVYPQEQAAGATSKILSVTITGGAATAGGTHIIKIAGRNGVDGENYAFTINKGDTISQITAKITDTVNGVLGCPAIPTDFGYQVNLESKWRGLTANELNVEVDTQGNSLGLTYAIKEEQAAVGTPSITDALDAFGNEWNTIVINSYGTESLTMDALEAFNGIPGIDNPTGRYGATVFKPFIAFTGSLLDDPSDITDPRKDEVTIAICPAPNSKGFSYEAAANMATVFAVIAQNDPNLDVQNKFYPDMPTPNDIGSMANYDFRDAFVKKGCSTVDLENGKYKIKDFVTTYHPVGEVPAQFRYARNLNIDWNIRFSYFLLEQEFVLNNSISNDNDIVTQARDVIKPKEWKGVVANLFIDLADRALVVDAAFTRESIVVTIDSTNPDRLNTTLRYKRSNFARIASTIVTAGFNFG